MSINGGKGYTNLYDRASVAYSVAYRTGEQVAGSIPGSANILFPGLMIVIATGIIPLPSLPIVWTIFVWKSSQWPEKILCLVLEKEDSRKALVDALAAAV